MTCLATSEVRPSRTNYTWRDIMQTVSIAVDSLHEPFLFDTDPSVQPHFDLSTAHNTIAYLRRFHHA